MMSDFIPLNAVYATWVLQHIQTPVSRRSADIHEQDDLKTLCDPVILILRLEPKVVMHLRGPDPADDDEVARRKHDVRI